MENNQRISSTPHLAKPVLCDGFLIPMTDFVLEQLNEQNSRTKPMREVFNSLEKYANFLKQPLKLEMFVPCDEDGNVLEYFPIHRFADNPEKYRRYKKAKENVLFELSIDSDYKFDISDYKFICNYYVNLENWLKDNDVLYKIKLSQTALDSIFGKTVA